MDHKDENQAAAAAAAADDDDEEGAKDDRFFIEASSSSEDERKSQCSHHKRGSSSSRKQASQLSRGSSPPLLLAFSITSGRPQEGSIQGPASTSQEEEEEDSDQPIEEWMILGEEEQVGDSSIQLNLSYLDSPEEDSGDEGQNVKTDDEMWAVSVKDKYGDDQFLNGRYFALGRSLICNICNRMGHLGKNCYYHKKCPICVLCGIQGHVRRDCPGRPCPSCGLPSHGFRPCERPPLWNQHCQRCGMAGHLSDACPDTWRQYHLTVRLEVPHRPQTAYALKHKKCLAHCYNCSERGHYGYECTKRRMSSGTSPSLPYVCHYDTIEEILERRTMMQKKVKELVSPGSQPLSDQQQSEATGESGEENKPGPGRSKTKQESYSRPGKRKTWPERRRERREVKKLRREAQARREGGLLGRPWGHLDDEVCPSDPFKSSHNSHMLPTSPLQKKRRGDEGDRRSRKSREAERWKKRGGIKRGELHPYGDMDIGSENLLSPKQRVRHRKR